MLQASESNLHSLLKIVALLNHFVLQIYQRPQQGELCIKKKENRRITTT